MLGMYAPSALGFGLLMFFHHCIVQTDDVRAFVMLEKLQCSAPRLAEG